MRKRKEPKQIHTKYYKITKEDKNKEKDQTTAEGKTSNK